MEVWICAAFSWLFSKCLGHCSRSATIFVAGHYWFRYLQTKRIFLAIVFILMFTYWSILLRKEFCQAISSTGKKYKRLHIPWCFDSFRVSVLPSVSRFSNATRHRGVDVQQTVMNIHITATGIYSLTKLCTW